VREELAWNPALDSRRITVTASDGGIVLRGAVDTFAEVELAGMDAWAVSGVTAVDNELLVGLAGAIIADGDIAAEWAAVITSLKLVPDGAVSAACRPSRPRRQARARRRLLRPYPKGFDGAPPPADSPMGASACGLRAARGRSPPATPRGRRFFKDKIRGVHSLSGEHHRGGGEEPTHVAVTLTGAMGSPILQIVALCLCVRALGGGLHTSRSALSTWGRISSSAPLWCLAALVLRRPL
jgi:hypothetical protein